jgi:UDP-N-acetylmuramoyl-tripeptide--D-alanyl-D-alanine ligase
LRLIFENPTGGQCARRLDRDVLGGSLELGQKFLLAHQKPEGNFSYEYDWQARSQSTDDNQVRQAGAAWGLALLYQDSPSEAVEAGVIKALDFFDRHSVVAPSGTRCIAYPGNPRGTTGTVALVALANIEYLRASRAHRHQNLAKRRERTLGQYLAHLVAAINPDGLWYGGYDAGDCRPDGGHSPYSDGEALLALAKAAKYLDYRDLIPTVLKAARAGHLLNVERALAEDPDSDVTKGFYQWSSMAFFEIATSGWPGTQQFGDHVIDLADWMIDVHRTLWRTRNTAYAYEGLIHAYELARRRADAEHQAKFACVIDVGLEYLSQWQVGGPLANRYAGEVSPDHRLAIGGIQNRPRQPGLRIDVTQHQMHAILLARRYVYTGSEAR